MNLSNFKLQVIGRGEGTNLQRVVELAFAGNAPGGTAICWKVDETGLRLYWNATDRIAIALPFPLKAEQAAWFVGGWLDSLSEAEYGPRPNIDGSVAPNAWEISAESGRLYEILRVKPRWAEIHK